MPFFKKESGYVPKPDMPDPKRIHPTEQNSKS
jgi:hypothetical protein